MHFIFDLNSCISYFTRIWFHPCHGTAFHWLYDIYHISTVDHKITTYFCSDHFGPIWMEAIRPRHIYSFLSCHDDICKGIFLIDFLHMILMSLNFVPNEGNKTLEDAYLSPGPLLTKTYRIPHSLQWQLNGGDGVSNHRRFDCLFSHLFRHISKKTSKLCVTGLCEGNSPVRGEFPTQRASNKENVSIWWHHHDKLKKVWWPSHVYDRNLNIKETVSSQGIESKSELGFSRAKPESIRPGKFHTEFNHQI